MQYVAMITNRGIVPASKNMRKYYKRDPKFKAGIGKGDWMSSSGVVRYLPKRGSEGSVMKKTRKLRRTALNFPRLDIKLSNEGKAAVKVDQTVRSIHMLLVEFLGREELVNAIGLGKILRRIGALADQLKADEKHCRSIRKPLQDLIQKMSAVFFTVERADVMVPHLGNPTSSSSDDITILEKVREYFAHMNWTHAVPSFTRHRLAKLDELPIENRITDEVISALFRQHQRWMARQGPADDDGQAPDQAPQGSGSRKTKTILSKFWGQLYMYLSNERALGDGLLSEPDSGEVLAQPPILHEKLMEACTRLLDGVPRHLQGWVFSPNREDGKLMMSSTPTYGRLGTRSLGSLSRP